MARRRRTTVAVVPHRPAKRKTFWSNTLGEIQGCSTVSPGLWFSPPFPIENAADANIAVVIGLLYQIRTATQARSGAISHGPMGRWGMYVCARGLGWLYFSDEGTRPAVTWLSSSGRTCAVAKKPGSVSHGHGPRDDIRDLTPELAGVAANWDLDAGQEENFPFGQGAVVDEHVVHFAGHLTRERAAVVPGADRGAAQNHFKRSVEDD